MISVKIVTIAITWIKLSMPGSSAKLGYLQL